MMELTGEIPGLLRRCSPLIDPSDGERSVVVSVVEGIGVRCSVERDCRVESYNYTFRSLCLDTSDPTGRLHARLWLLERGHDVGNEDRAEVLAWSVLSVWRGGGPIRLVLGPWWQQGVTWRRDGWRGLDKVTAAVGPTNCSGIEWEILTWFPNSTSRDAGHYGRGFESIEAAKAACDAAAIASRWALTNDDGTLTLPPLPGAK